MKVEKERMEIIINKTDEEQTEDHTVGFMEPPISDLICKERLLDAS